MIEFPPLDTASDDGLLAIGGDLNLSTLLTAYSNGIFPWPISETDPLLWFAPDPRSVIYTKNFHLPKSLAKILRQEKFQTTFNQNFSEVIKKCALAKRKNQSKTWITKDMIDSYTKFHRLGYAYSVEVLLQGELVGGIYGVNIGSFFSGESMFFDHPNASKVALVTLLDFLGEKCIPFLDIQMTTEVTASLGAKEISRTKFNSELKRLLGGAKVF